MSAPKVPRTFVEDMRNPVHTPGKVCNAINWTRRPGCNRTTNWSCGDCGAASCATHAHWHRKPDTKTWGRTKCDRMAGGRREDTT